MKDDYDCPHCEAERNRRVRAEDIAKTANTGSIVLCLLTVVVSSLLFTSMHRYNRLARERGLGTEIEQVARLSAEKCAEEGQSRFWMLVDMDGTRVERVKGDCWR